jgi:preprotein translocase subunit SecG
VSLLIILIVLMQRPKSEGLGAAFGGGMTENLFGAQTSNVLANATRWLGGIFFFLTLVLSILYAKQSMQHSAIQAALLKAAAEATPTPAPSPAAASVPASTGAAALSGTTGAVPLNLSAPAATASNPVIPAKPLPSAPATSGTASH